MVERFKTGTPPRIDGRSVDFSRLERQESEIEAFDYSWSVFWADSRRRGEETRHPVQLPCWITFLEAGGKAIITENIGRSAMYGGAIASRGPRYCPSVEDKVVKFPNADRHQLFLEPEGHDTTELYVNGLSTSLPATVQLEILRSVRGLESVAMTRAGYAIEYDYYPPTQLDASLQVKAMRGLFFAGQINGTTGYEEAAGQGVIAGLNAARFVRRDPPVVLGRETSYIGVLIDDLVTRGVDEPYRLFTSRSEFRLTVRQDNAVRRLGPIGIALELYTRTRRVRSPARPAYHPTGQTPFSSVAVARRSTNPRVSRSSPSDRGCRSRRCSTPPKSIAGSKRRHWSPPSWNSNTRAISFVSAIRRQSCDAWARSCWRQTCRTT
jgi:tRNA uridine 5-carboxymethylaminomethyl modification enzyme